VVGIGPSLDLGLTTLLTVCHNLGNKRHFSQILEFAPQPLKRRKLKLLADSTTIYQTQTDPPSATQPPGPPQLPSFGAGFRHLTTYPNIIAADKTRYIEMLDMDSSYQYLFLRPRRFGKSTFLQTLSSYYDKSLQEKFADTFAYLYIGQHPTEAASSLLVLCFDFSEIGSASLEETKQLFHDYINSVLRDFLATNSRFLNDFKENELLIEAQAQRSLTNVLVRYIFWPSCLFAKLDVM